MDEFSLQFRAWMDRHRMKASDVADALFVTEQAVRNWRSAGVPPRRQAQLSDWMTSVDAAHASDPIDYLRTRPLVVDATFVEWTMWENAAFASGKKLTTWAREGLNKLAIDQGFGAAGVDGALKVEKVNLNPDDEGNDVETALPIEKLPTTSEEGAA